MIVLQRGDITAADAEALVNTVNCVGVMGRGIALQFKRKYPENFKAYKAACDHEQLRIGTVLVHDMGQLTNPRYIINFPTKRHWKGKSKLEDIQSGLIALVAEVEVRAIRSIAVPPLGCGMGGLKWDVVRPLVEKAFRPLPDVRVLLFEPHEASTTVSVSITKERPPMTIGRAALLGLMRRYLSGGMDPSITLLELHKLMYFMQETGEPLKLRYEKGTYGPYAANLRHVLERIDGWFIEGYGGGEEQPDRSITLQPGAAEEAEELLRGHPQTSKRFDRVVGLIEGFETPFGMELLATVHWVAMKENTDSIEEVVRRTFAWNQRKRMFREQHISLAWEVLRSKGWLNPLQRN